MPLVEQVFDVEVDRDGHHIRRQRVQQVRGSRAEVDDDLRVRRETAQEAEIRSRSAGPPIEAAQVAQRALHVLARRVVLVEQLLGDDAFHGTSMNAVRHGARSTLSCATGVFAASKTSMAYGPGRMWVHWSDCPAATPRKPLPKFVS